MGPHRRLFRRAIRPVSKIGTAALHCRRVAVFRHPWREACAAPYHPDSSESIALASLSLKAAPPTSAPGERLEKAIIATWMVGDFNGDGVLDLAVANLFSNNVSVLINSTQQPSGP